VIGNRRRPPFEGGERDRRPGSLALSANLDSLVRAVQENCRLSDARHARNMTMCTYLLEMREQYRWERGLALDAVLPRGEIGAWLSEREAQWDALEHRDYLPLPSDDGRVDPFAAAAVNRSLVPRGWVYGAGVGRFGKPQFFLAELQREEWRNGVHVLVAGREHVRDLAPAPAALRADTIHVRPDVLRRLLWERATLWTQRRAGGAFKAVLDACGFADDPMSALESMVEAETETLILHELGEHAASVSLSPAWERMLDGFVGRPAELFARAVRDHLADCTVTLPALVARGASASIHLWFAGLDGLRRELFPRARNAYDCWRRGDDGRALVAAAADGTAHWQRVCDAALALAGRGGSDAERAIAALATDGATRL
jgi:hypothetical protein